jgi:RNA polymerase sigma factor (sigma-70 family)
MNKESYNARQMDELTLPLVRYLAKKVPISEDANDLAQEAFLRMFKFQQTEKLENASAFLFKTANNLLIDQIRRSRLHDNYLSAVRPPEQTQSSEANLAPSAERTISAREQLDKAMHLIDSLPDKAKRAFLLNRSAGMSYAEIAVEMQVSKSMVEKYIIAALKVLRDGLRTD